MSHVKLVGLEIEGGWEGTPGKPPFDIPIIADHSIDGRTLPSESPLQTTHVGEVVSEPMQPNLDVINAWLEKYWPDEVNNTCGYHIHASFDSLKDYSLLTMKSFSFLLRKELHSAGEALALPPNHHLFQRLEGKNPFALLNFDASKQIKLRHKSVGDRTRYGFVNCCWGIHGTFEFRALPAFKDVNLAKHFTKCYLDFVEYYLEKSRDIVLKHGISLRLENGLVVKEELG